MFTLSSDLLRAMPHRGDKIPSLFTQQACRRVQTSHINWIPIRSAPVQSAKTTDRFAPVGWSQESAVFDPIYVFGRPVYDSLITSHHFHVVPLFDLWERIIFSTGQTLPPWD